MKKTIKIIDLLVRCNLGDLTLLEKIKKGDKVYKKESSTVGHYYYIEDNGNTLLDDTNNFVELNYELEIIEEDKEIEKLEIKDIYMCDDYGHIYINFKNTWNKINEIIDAVNSMNKGE